VRLKNIEVSVSELFKIFLPIQFLIILFIQPLVFAGEDTPIPQKSAVQKEGRSSIHLFSLPGLKNVGKVAPGIYRGALPEPEGYNTLKEMGIKTVLDLRAGEDEKEPVEKAGMKSIEIPISFITKMSDEEAKKVLAVITATENHPIFIHCRQGQDRTGVVVALYRMEIEGWSNAEAEEEMESFGFNGIWICLKNFVREYKRTNTAK
jgi:tyrosine-protein phosphatase SIW14